MQVKEWMAWEGGVDLSGMTREGLAAPNLLVHVARSVSTPRGRAPSGMVLWQPEPDKDPAIAGFVSADPAVGTYFGRHIFAGTPFENAPFLEAEIAVETEPGSSARSRVDIGGRIFEVELTGLGRLEALVRDPSATAPFAQQVLEAVAGSVRFWLDGQEIGLVLPKIGISGGPPAVWAPAGIYAR